ncbi:hypothetical protein RJ639_014789 [Escallonia herrerae]|uniref:Retrotransposon Copia-like N-terminal domain-containing protein n=1 Tax=Escallonia herrerae TaxID=1293975 RepID=A0AA88VHG3_9ASTE|nr:hypothetical protein RJ639_014789 [Escallonia herrerae]
MASMNTTNPTNPIIPATSYTQPPQIIFQQDNSAFPTSIVLDETNFPLWSQLMEMRIGARNKVGYLTGETVKPATNDPSYATWIIDNHKVKSWLIYSMSPHLMQQFIQLATAKEIWEAVAKTFYDGSDETHITRKTLGYGVKRDKLYNLELSEDGKQKVGHAFQTSRVEKARTRESLSEEPEPELNEMVKFQGVTLDLPSNELEYPKSYSPPSPPSRFPARSNRGIPKKQYEPDLKANVKYPINNYTSTHRLSDSYALNVDQLSTISIPSSVQEALADPRWTKAMNEEMEALEKKTQLRNWFHYPKEEDSWVQMGVYCEA